MEQWSHSLSDCVLVDEPASGCGFLVWRREWAHGAGIRHARRARCAGVRGCGGALKVPDARTARPLPPCVWLSFTACARSLRRGGPRGGYKLNLRVVLSTKPAALLDEPALGCGFLVWRRDWAHGAGIRHARRARCAGVRGSGGALKVPDARTARPIPPCVWLLLTACARSLRCGGLRGGYKLNLRVVFSTKRAALLDEPALGCGFLVWRREWAHGAGIRHARRARCAGVRGCGEP